MRGPRGGLILARANEEIEKKLNSAVFPGAQGGPLMHVIAAKAVCFKEALEPGFKDYQAQVIRNAKAMAEVFIGRGYDDELLAAMDAEDRRQEDHIELIASENYASKRVMQAQGSGLTNKYAEGYPGKRYYGGCEHVDKVEQLAIDRARQLFGADYANVQPHSGSSANAAVYLALLNAGDTILGMSLAHGGHLTHGA
ncbi:hypothetical protein IPC113_31200, partial [Pseudomonas aeruginosa]